MVVKSKAEAEVAAAAEGFFATDQDGSRIYLRHVQHSRIGKKLSGWIVAICGACIAVLLVVSFFRPDQPDYDLWGFPIWGIFAIVGGGMLIVFVNESTTTSNWDRALAHYMLDNLVLNAKHAATSASPVTTQQPHGHGDAEGTI